MKIFVGALLFASSIVYAETSPYSFKGTVGPFYDGNVSQSVSFENNSALGEGPGSEGPGGGPGHGGPGGGPGGPPPGGRPTGTVYIDWGAIGNLEFGRTMVSDKKDEVNLTLGLDTASYQTYTTYNYEAVKVGPNWTHTLPSSDEIYTALYYQSTFYQGIYSQDYVKFESSYSWKKSSPEMSVGLDYTQYTRTHSNEDTVSLPFSVAWKGDTTTWTLSYTATLGSGLPAQYTYSTQPPTSSGGDEFSRYQQWVASAGVEKKFNDSWKGGFSISQTQTSYAQETLSGPLPPGVPPNARFDNIGAASFDLKYQIKDRWSCDLSGSFTRSWSSGYQGLPTTTSAPASYSFDRPYAALTGIYEI